MATQLNSSGFRRINPVIHERTRLAIMTYLITAKEATFSEIKEELGLTDGNLNIHMKVIEKSGFVKVTKEFVNRRPRTTYTVTEKGFRAFRDYVAQLEEILGWKGDAGRARVQRKGRGGE